MGRVKDECKKEIEMINLYEQKNVIKASHSAVLLAKDLREAVTSENPLLAQICRELLQQALELEDKMKRLESAMRQG